MKSLKFGNWTVISFAGKRKNKLYWNCKCDCGNVSKVSASNLKSGDSTKCVQCRNTNNIKNLNGHRFGKLSVVKFAYRKNGKSYYSCKCDCGETVDVRSDCLTTGNTRSCGCLVTDTNSKINSVTKEKLYRVWYGMKSRCDNLNNKHYQHYGGRGVKISDEWNTYGKFKSWAIDNGYVDGLSIDRIDVNGNYAPNNCRWVTIQKQQENKRNNKYYTHNGKCLLLRDWSKLTGIKEETLYSRINTLGWDFESAITMKVKGNQSL